MSAKHFCINHPTEVAHYIAGGKAYGPCCKEIAYRRARRETLRQDAGRVDEFQLPQRRLKRKDAATYQVM